MSRPSPGDGTDARRLHRLIEGGLDRDNRHLLYRLVSDRDLLRNYDLHCLLVAQRKFIELYEHRNRELDKYIVVRHRQSASDWRSHMIAYRKVWHDLKRWFGDKCIWCDYQHASPEDLDGPELRPTCLNTSLLCHKCAAAVGRVVYGEKMSFPQIDPNEVRHKQTSILAYKVYELHGFPARKNWRIAEWNLVRGIVNRQQTNA